MRRAFLCGVDKQSGQSYEHRKAWIIDKMRHLASVFAIDICAYAVMSNHYHVVLKVNKEQVDSWSDKQIAKRWTQLFKAPLLVARWLDNNEQAEGEIAGAKAIINQWRDRLHDISWFMRILNEGIARQANEEDNCKGRFWEGRFKSQALLDEAAILSCMAYVDLNPVRAGLSDTPETSEFTSIHERLQGWHKEEASREAVAAELLPFSDQTQDENAVPFTWKDYLSLLDYSGKVIKSGKRGYVPEHYPNILIRLGIADEDWEQCIRYYEKRFPSVVGHFEKMRAFAREQGKLWVRGMRNGFRSDLTVSC